MKASIAMTVMSTMSVYKPLTGTGIDVQFSSGQQLKFAQNSKNSLYLILIISVSTITSDSGPEGKEVTFH